jgi:hypothetical protein
MSDFLHDLAGRALGVSDVLRPRPATAFERPAPDAADAVPRSPSELAAAVPAHRNRHEDAPVPRRRTAPAPVPPRRADAPLPAPLEQTAENAAAPAAEAATEPATEPETRPAAERLPPELRPRSVAGAPSRDPAGRSSPTQSTETPPPAEPAEQRSVAPARIVETRVFERRAPAPEPNGSPRRAPTAAPSAGARRRQPDRSAVEEEQEPVVHVHIDRVEVRAPAPAAPRPQAPRAREPKLSLADYLAQTSGRRP